MPDINLLPEELKPKGFALKIAKTLNKLALFTVLVSFLVLLLIGGSSLLLSLNLRRVNSQDEVLKGQVKALEQTEQKLVLVKDRIGKIQAILASGGVYDEVDLLKAIIDKKPQNVTFLSSKIVPDGVSIKFNAKTSFDITDFYKVLYEAKIQKFELVSFNFSSDTGYEVEVKVSV